MNSCLFDPRTTGPMKIISEIIEPEYWKQRAIEFIQSGNLKQAIGLLALSLAWDEQNDQI